MPGLRWEGQTWRPVAETKLTLCTIVPAADPSENSLGAPYWVFRNEYWGDDYAEADELDLVRSWFEAEGFPFTMQYYPAPEQEEDCDGCRCCY